MNRACSDLCGGCAATRIPTANGIAEDRTFEPTYFSFRSSPIG